MIFFLVLHTERGRRRGTTSVLFTFLIILINTFKTPTDSLNCISLAVMQLPGNTMAGKSVKLEIMTENMIYFCLIHKRFS